ncbi:Galactoside O-acetyltransferase [compost metagenome]
MLIGPNVSIFTAGHPVTRELRAEEYEFALPITIGNYVWIGGGSIINPGVTIGDNTIIGSGSVVTKDIPANVIAVGNPCKVLREITDEDKERFLEKF